ncbi:MerR family transcriptional regulator [Modestobacter marinus]|uniref:DNA-binding transcriptional MerR regulator n=1 Tax=Modestobacter marinus TaxID=477641 RepID=A0A846LKB1_9ACTN|nr:MerR family transcriptional regulator [Modestobacter marinus]NIH67004.1 DNA-binding transcriptional MerR regulator [Modestobacter marinus]GGL51160.1 MerR family transcriptional regulator [Modestobacter marinus]
MGERHMQIGEVAERTGLSVRTIRFYEESGLATPTARSSGGFRLYTDGDVERLMVIRRMKPLDFTIDEIRDVLQLLDRLRSREPGTTAPPDPELVERLAMYRELADQRVATLHTQWSSAAAFATSLRLEVEQVHAPRGRRR